MALSKRERGLLIVTIAALVIGAQYLVAVPLSRSWKRVGDDLKAGQADLEYYRGHIARMPEWQAEMEQLRSQVGEKITEFVEMSDVLKKIQEVGDAAGVIITERKELPENDRGVYRELPVRCRLDATTESLVKFLYALRTGSGFVNVDQLQVQPQPNNVGVLRCEILIHALAVKTKSVTP